MTEGEGLFQGLWIVTLAENLKFESIAKRLGYPSRGPILLAFSFAVFDSTVLEYIAYLQTGRVEMFVNPVSLHIILSWPLGIWAMQRVQHLANKYTAELPSSHPLIVNEREPDFERRFLSALGIPVEDTDTSDATPQFLTTRLQTIILLLALGYYIALVVFGFSWDYIMTYWGPVAGAIRLVFIVPVVYFFGSQIVSVFCAVYVLLPLWISEGGYIDFSDPRGFGGLRPAGTLLKKSTFYYLLGVAVYAVLLVATPEVPAQSLFPNATIFIGMIFGVILFFGPAYWIHRHMRSAKETRLQALEDEIRECGPKDDQLMFPETPIEKQKEIDEYTHGYIQLSQVRSMHEYPIDVSMVQEFLFVLLLPYIAHLSSIFVFKYIHL